jgi:hypothetical protein
MKNLLLTLLSVFLINGTINAQSALEKGGIQMNVGVGFSGWGLPVFVGVDYGVHQDVTIGAELSYRNYRNKYVGVQYNHTVLGFLVNGNYHFNTLLELPDPWDLYAGLNLGFYSWVSSDKYPGNSGSGLGLGLQIGGRYYFSDKLGVNLELGGGNTVSGGKIGLTVKF